MNEAAIKVYNVSKSFRLPHEKSASIKGAFINVFRDNRTFEKQSVINDLSFEIKKGEFFGIAGRNGSGKSTLLKLLAGVYLPDDGAIQVNGRLTPFIELGVGFNPELTGKENVFLNGALLGFNRKEMEAMYNDIVEFAELENFMDQKLKNYSSGMQVRLAFSIAIRADTEILLFDEVLAVGDERFQRKCLDIFRELKRSGKTIILVSHNTADMERFCDRVLVLNKGRSLGIHLAREAVTLYQELNLSDADSREGNTPTKRMGNGEVRIKSLKVSSKNSKSKTIITGKALKIEFKLERKKNISKTLPIKIGFAIYDAEGVHITGPNSYEANIRFLPGQEEVDVCYELQENILNKGDYSVTVAVVNDGESFVYDHAINFYSFSVISERSIQGKIVLSGKWTTK